MNLTKWIFPGIVAIIALSAGTVWFQHSMVEQDLEMRTATALSEKFKWADINARGRDLTLVGTAPTELDKSATVDLARDIYGVRIVEDQIKLLPLQSPYNFTASFGAGGVTLSGYLPNDDVQNNINTFFTSNLPGIEVTNETVLARGAPREFAIVVPKGLALLKNLSNWDLSVEDQNITIKGTAIDRAGYDAVLAVTSQPLAEGYQLENINVQPPKVKGDYRIEIQKNAENIVLDGYVPGEAMRQNLLEQIRQTYPDLQIVDNLELASDAPDSFGETIDVMIAQISNLSDGTIALNANDMSISGALIEGVSVDMIQQSILDSIPSDIVVSDLMLNESSNNVWSITKDANGVSLKGPVPDEDIKNSLLKRAQNSFGVNNVTDEQEIRSYGPNDSAVAFLSLVDIMSRFQDGTAQLSKGELTLSGNVLLASSMPLLDEKLKVLADNGIEISADIMSAPSPEDTAELQLRGDDCQINLGRLMSSNKILFDVGKSDIISDSYGFLDNISYGIRRCGDTKIEVGGHTDSDGNDASNQQLSELRASSVLSQLLDRGVSGDRLNAVGYGEQLPVADNADDAGKKLNRRIEFKIK